MPSINDYAITFGYPDGTTSAVWGQSCSDELRTGAAQPRQHASQVLDSYLTELSEQRATMAPREGNITSDHACPRNDNGGSNASLLPRQRTLDLQSATVCAYRWTKVEDGEFAFVLTSQHPVSPDELTVLNAGFARDATPLEPKDEVGNQLDTIVGTTRWHDRIYLSLLNGELVRNPSPAQPGSKSLGWRLSSAEIAQLIGS